MNHAVIWCFEVLGAEGVVYKPQMMGRFPTAGKYEAGFAAPLEAFSTRQSNKDC